MSAHLRALARRQRALEGVADIHDERGEIREVEALHLVVAEDHQDVGARRGELRPQGRERGCDARLLGPVVLE